MSAPLVVIDTNVWLDYFDPTSRTAEADRQLLRRAKKNGLVRPLLTAPISAELMRTCARDGFERYAAMMRFAWNMCGARVLATDDDREEAELRHRRKLSRREGEALMTLDRRRGFRDEHMLDEEHALKIAQVVAQTHVDHAPLERAQRDNTIRELDEKQSGWRDVMLASVEQREELMASWARDEMVTLATKLGLPAEEGSLPDPRKLPSFYIPKVVHVTHLHGVLLTGRSPTATDLYDRTALRDAAAYADMLVTTDDQLTKLAGRTTLPLRVLDYAAWNAELRRLVGS